MQYSPPPIINGSNFSEEKIESFRSKDELISITALLSPECNLHCSYCYSNAGSKPPEIFNFEQWKNTLNQARNLGAEALWIPGSGEPFLDPSFHSSDGFPLIEFANQIGMNVTFFTNGTLINEKLAHQLFDMNVSIVTKLNSFNPSIQDLLVGKKNAYKLIQRGLISLISAGFNSSNPSRLGIDTVITSYNYHEIINLFKFCRDNNIIPYITVNLHGGRSCQNTQLDVSKEEIKKLFYTILEIDQKEYGFSWLPSPPIIGSQCKKLLYDIVVDYKGDVFVCPGIEIKIGNILESPLQEIISNSSLLKRIRMIPETLEGKCKNCLQTDCVYGCRLEALHSGDLFGEDPFCWH